MKRRQVTIKYALGRGDDRRRRIKRSTAGWKQRMSSSKASDDQHFHFHASPSTHMPANASQIRHAVPMRDTRWSAL
eukprot:3344219-Pyramimonas_sp.AAC.1